MKCSISLLQNYSSSGVESKGAEVESWNEKEKFTMILRYTFVKVFSTSGEHPQQMSFFYNCNNHYVQKKQKSMQHNIEIIS